MKILYIIFVFFISGCCSLVNKQVSFYPETLPIASLGKEYYIKIQSNGAPVRRLSIMGKESESNNGLKIKTYVDNSMHGFIEISGVPNKTGEIIFEVEGGTPGTACSGARFKKKFTLLISSTQSKTSFSIINSDKDALFTACI